MIHFRPASLADYPAICTLIPDEEEMFRIYPAGKFPLTVEQLAQLAEVRKELTVAELDSHVIGFANLYNFEAGKSAYIGNVVIDRVHRGRRYGRALITHMLDIAANKLRLPEVYISVFAHNVPATRLYENFGFRPCATEQREDYNGKQATLNHLKLVLTGSEYRE